MLIENLFQVVNAKADFAGKVSVGYRYSDPVVTAYRKGPEKLRLTEVEENTICFDFIDEDGEDVAGVSITVDDRETGDGPRVLDANVEDGDDEELLPYYRNLCFWAIMKVTDPEALKTMPVDFLA